MSIYYLINYVLHRMKNSAYGLHNSTAWSVSMVVTQKQIWQNLRWAIAINAVS